MAQTFFKKKSTLITALAVTMGGCAAPEALPAKSGTSSHDISIVAMEGTTQDCYQLSADALMYNYDEANYVSSRTRGAFQTVAAAHSLPDLIPDEAERKKLLASALLVADNRPYEVEKIVLANKVAPASALAEMSAEMTGILYPVQESGAVDMTKESKSQKVEIYQLKITAPVATLKAVGCPSSTTP